MSIQAEKVSEDEYAEQPALEWLTGNGWTYQHGTELGPETNPAERSHDSDVVLKETLERCVARLNPDLPADAATRVVELVMATSAPDFVRDHFDFHRLLVGGVPIDWLDDDGAVQSGRARLVDWESTSNNEFLAVNQLTIIEGGKNRRPDILLFINGLPLGQIELKNPANEKATAQTAVNQVHHYTATIPRLYRYVEIVGVSDVGTALAGTPSTPKEHFAEWKSMDRAASKGKTPLEVTIDGLFAPGRLLGMVRNFILFETDGAKTSNFMAKYHQVDAVNRAIEETARAMADDGRAGVVWHTQGSGKSYSMVFYAAKLRWDPRFENPTIVCLTDTNDLDNQLHETFKRQWQLSPQVQQAERIEGTRESLYSLLDVPAGGIVFTTIQKFARGKDEAPMPVLSKRRNVIVVADEAHRSQYAGLARNVHLALPNATKIGFTGTPIETADRDTRLAFGDYISIYRMSQAQEDGATVPIYYESRQVPVEVDDPSVLLELEEVLEQEEMEAAGAITSAWARLEKVVSAPGRLEKVVDDLVAHYQTRCRLMTGKALVVAYSRRTAAEYANLLKARLGDDAVTAVFGASADEDKLLSDYRRNKQEMAQVEKDFKDPDNPLRIVVVKNMWLTGFDVPCLHTLYIDKPMKDHGLLQAIARVNRVFDGKDGGTVVDYIGIGDDLRASLTAYSANEVDDMVIPLEVAKRKLVEKHEVLTDMLHGIDFRPSEGMTPGEKTTQWHVAREEAAARFVEDDEQVKVYLSEQAQYAKWFKLVSPNSPSSEQRYDHDFFAATAKVLRDLLSGEVGSGVPSEAAEQAVKQFFAEGLSGGDVVDVFELAGKDRPEISVLSDDFLDSIGTKVSRPELQVALLRKLLNGEIRTRLGANRTQAALFSEKLREVLAKYSAKQLTSAEVVAALVELAKEMREARKRHEDMGLSEEEAAFYDALAGGSEDWTADPQLASIAAELVKSIRNDLSVDWADRANTEAAIRTKIKRLLRKPENREAMEKYLKAAKTGGGSGIDDVADRIFQQAKTLYRYWPDVEGVLFEGF